MTVTVRFFASLRERLAKDEQRLEIAQGATVADIWRLVAADTDPARILVAINLNYADFNATVKDGDEVAFFPPVTGG